MLRLLSILVISTLIGNTSFAQTTDPFEVQQKVYSNAMKHYDMQTATVAMYQMIALKPARTDLNDSLAMLYFAQERFPQAYILGEEILKTNPEKATIREVVAIAKQNMGLTKEALADYEKLYEQQKSPFYLYQTATLQYQLKRYGECVTSLDQIIGQKEAEEQKVNIRMQSGTQDVPMKAAAYNVKGICAMEMNQPDVAKANFTKALEIYPEFVLAKGNLENLNKPAATNTPASTTPSPASKKK